MAPVVAPTTDRPTERPGARGTRVLLADGRSVELRPILPDDEPRLERFHEGLSDATVRNRFFTVHPHLTPLEAHRLTHVDRRLRDAVVALDGRTIVGVGRYEPTELRGVAELGLVVTDSFQGVGLGCALLRAVARMAADRGYGSLVATVLSTNRRMLGVLVRCGLPRAVTSTGGCTRVVLRLDEGAGAVTRSG